MDEIVDDREGRGTIGKETMLQDRFHPYHMGSMAEWRIKAGEILIYTTVCVYDGVSVASVTHVSIFFD